MGNARVCVPDNEWFLPGCDWQCRVDRVSRTDRAKTAVAEKDMDDPDAGIGVFRTGPVLLASLDHLYRPRACDAAGQFSGLHHDAGRRFAVAAAAAAGSAHSGAAGARRSRHDRRARLAEPVSGLSARYLFRFSNSHHVCGLSVEHACRAHRFRLLHADSRGRSRLDRVRACSGNRRDRRGRLPGDSHLC